MADTSGEETRREPSPIRITIEIDRPRLGLRSARGHMRAAVRETLLSLREVLDAGIETLNESDESATEPEKIAIE